MLRRSLGVLIVMLAIGMLAPRASTQAQGVTADFQLDYTAAGVTITNVSDVTQSVAGLEFSSTGGTWRASQWSTSRLLPTDCLQVFDFAQRQPARPPACGTMQSWSGTGKAAEHFWTADFTVTKSGETLATCAIAAGMCSFSLTAGQITGNASPPQTDTSTTTAQPSSGTTTQPQGVAPSANVPPTPPVILVAFNGANMSTIEANRGDIWNFDGQEGQLVSIQTQATWNSVMILSSPDGKFVAWNDNGPQTANAQIDNVYLSETGTYQIEVFGFSAEDFGPYTLFISTATGSASLSPTPQSTARLAQIGSNSGELTPGGANYWGFRGQSGQTLRIEVNGNFNSVLVLTGPDGQFIAWNDNRPDTVASLVDGVQLSANGTYIIRVFGFSASDSGPYSLDITQG